jgi:cytochrome c5
MKAMIRNRGLSFAVTVTLALVAVGGAAAGQNDPDANRGEMILNGSCMSCHDLRPIEVQALDKAGWTDTVNRMVEKGTTFEKDSDIPLLIDYLVQTHGPLPDGAGKPILLNTCTVCHDLSRVKRHGANREQWQETLEAMLNEGAQLSEEDFPVLLNYLARNFKPQ